MEQGGVLKTHTNVPNSVREQLYTEENQRLNKKKKATENSTSGSPPTNATMPTGPSYTESIAINGLLDIAVDNYTKWQKSHISNEAFKDNIKKAYDIALENCLDLSQIYEDQDPDFFVKYSVKIGATRRFVRDIGFWVKRCEEITCLEDSINLV
ncbi:unnamed protein product [Penicillium salamii]|nr:unnamed protein product [Penicillium salamii]